MILLTGKPGAAVDDIAKAHEQPEDIMSTDPEETVAVLCEGKPRQFLSPGSGELPAG